MTAMFEFDLVVIGSGPAGHSAAIQAAKLGKRVALIERRASLGGVSTNLGTLPSKTFREAVMALRRGTVKRALNAAGEDPINLTMPMLLERVNSVITADAQEVRGALLRNGVTILRGFASFVDTHTISVDSPEGDRRVTTEFVLVACGTHPVLPANCPDQSNINRPSIITSDNVSSLAEIPKTMIIVGGGVIGVEYASFFAELGTKVTLVERSERPISFMDHELVDEMIHSLRGLDMTFRCGEAVAKILPVDESPPRVLVELESGKRLAADVALISAGRQGCTDGLHLECAGLAADERGRLKVDAQYRTAIESIFAA